MDLDVLTTILSVLFTALVITAVFRYLRIPLVLGYLFVGALMGPHAIGIIPDVDDINHLAEFGIVFLMFTVGLEFSQPKLFALKSAVFVIGAIQVALCILLTTAAGLWLGMNLLAAFVVGSIVAMSSTAIVIKQLNDQRELYTPYGLDVVGILLFQDIAVIPLMILMVALSNTNTQALSIIFILAILKGIIAISVISIAGRWFLKPLFHLIAKTKVIELFTLTVLLITLTAAWLTNILGLSYALGAFLAGMMLSETEFRHQIEIEIRPFRDVLLGLFFITVGMLTDFAQWHQTWPWILLLLSALTFAKMLLVSAISHLSGRPWHIALRTGLALAEGGEFGFVLLTLALSSQLLPVEYGQVILAAILISMALSPFWINFNKKISNYVLPLLIKQPQHFLQQPLPMFTKELKRHIIICGYGRVGQHIARLLEKIPYPYVGIDLDPSLTQRANLAGDRIIYGDAGHPEILNVAGIKHAQALVICYSDVRAASKTLSVVRRLRHSMPALVRCKDQNDWQELLEHGATRIITQIFEESMTLTHQLLELVDVPENKITALFSEVRNQNYDLLRQVFPSSLSEDPNENLVGLSQLTPIIIPEDAYAIAHQLNEFNFQRINVAIVSMRRCNGKPFKPHPTTIIEANDILIVYGTPSATEQAEFMLLEG